MSGYEKNERNLYAKMHWFRLKRFIWHRRSVSPMYGRNGSVNPRKKSYAGGIKEGVCVRVVWSWMTLGNTICFVSVVNFANR